MLYKVVKILVRLALKLFCRRITFSHKSILQSKGPLLLACNHPNSFLDAIILGSKFKYPIHFLARGDAFKKPVAKKILGVLKLIPIYRLREGRENLALNDATFDKCREVLINNGILLIFSEGLCVNDWKLRPLRKGTARIAIDAWEQDSIKQNFRVLPVSINYNAFKYFGREIVINFGEIIKAKDIQFNETHAEAINNFNSLLYQRLKRKLIESRGNNAAVQMLISNNSHNSQNRNNNISLKLSAAEALTNSSKLVSPFYISSYLLRDLFSIIFLLIPAIVGWFLHAPLYFSLHVIIDNKTRGTVFYDSVMLGCMLFIYPVYWLVINTLMWFHYEEILIRAVFSLLPLFAWIFMEWKAKLVGVVNNFKIKNKPHQLKEIFN